MSRMSMGRTLGLGWLLISSVSLAQEQATDMNAAGLANAGVRDNKLLDLSMPSVSDPAAIDMLFTEGNTVASILDGLKEKGFHIQYREKHFLPTMTLLSLPKGERIDEVLREILEPWNFRVYRSPLGHWIVTPNKKKVSTGTDQKTQELVEHYKATHPAQE